ncbi:MAG: hypothetical protein ACRDHZ_26330 [Ktedonobacteraceae bacterium]
MDATAVRLSGSPMIPGERETGWPPFSLAMIVAGCFLTLQQDAAAHRNTLWRHWRFLITVLTASFILCWVLSLNIGGQSLWWFVYKFIPGGSAIRVPARFNLVLNVLVVVIVCIVLNRIKMGQNRTCQIIFWAASIFLIVEQINTGRNHSIRRNYENAIMGRVNRPPSSCSSFFITHPVQPPRPLDESNQVDAMLVARMYNIPTLNGTSSWFPTGWNLFTFGKSYIDNVKLWAIKKHVTGGLCGLDLRDGSWVSLDFKREVGGAEKKPGNPGH